MKIAALGNMNNYSYILSKYLIRRGYNVNLLLYKNEYYLFKPENDSFLPFDFPWIIQTDIIFDISFFLKSQKKILSQYDFFISCGAGPAFLAKYGLRPHIFIPYGSDLYHLPSPEYYRNTSNFGRMIFRLIRQRAQKWGIQNSNLISIIPMSHAYRKALKELKVEEKCVPLGFPFVDLDEWSPATVQSFYSQSTIFRQVQHFKENFDFIIFSPARQYWKCKDNPIANKGNNRLIIGVANASKKVNVGLVLIETGVDIDASKRLVGELGIEQRVLWLPEVPRREVYIAYSLSDLACDQLVSGGYGGSGFEAMAMGKPLLVYMSLSSEDYQEIAWRPFPPIVNVHTAEDVEAALLDFANRPEYYKQLGQDSRKWAELYYGDGLIDRFVYLIDVLYQRKKVDFSRLRFSISFDSYAGKDSKR